MSRCGGALTPDTAHRFAAVSVSLREGGLGPGQTRGTTQSLQPVPGALPSKPPAAQLAATVSCAGACRPFGALPPLTSAVCAVSEVLPAARLFIYSLFPTLQYIYRKSHVSVRWVFFQLSNIFWRSRARSSCSVFAPPFRSCCREHITGANAGAGVETSAAGSEGESVLVSSA